MEQKTNSDDAVKNNEGDNMSKKQETLDTLLILKENTDISLPKIAEHLGLEAMLITDEQKEKIEKYNKVKKLCGEIEPVDYINKSIEDTKQNADDVRESKLNHDFGLLEINGNNNDSRKYAEDMLSGKELNEKNIAEIKANSIYKKLAADIADFTSDLNRVGIKEDKKENSNGNEPIRAEY